MSSKPSLKSKARAGWGKLRARFLKSQPPKVPDSSANVPAEDNVDSGDLAIETESESVLKQACDSPALQKFKKIKQRPVSVGMENFLRVKKKEATKESILNSKRKSRRSSMSSAASGSSASEGSAIYAEAAAVAADTSSRDTAAASTNNFKLKCMMCANEIQFESEKTPKEGQFCSVACKTFFAAAKQSGFKISKTSDGEARLVDSASEQRRVMKKVQVGGGDRATKQKNLMLRSNILNKRGKPPGRRGKGGKTSALETENKSSSKAKWAKLRVAVKTTGAFRKGVKGKPAQNDDKAIQLSCLTCGNAVSDSVSTELGQFCSAACKKFHEATKQMGYNIANDGSARGLQDKAIERQNLLKKTQATKATMNKAAQARCKLLNPMDSSRRAGRGRGRGRGRKR